MHACVHSPLPAPDVRRAPAAARAPAPAKALRRCLQVIGLGLSLVTATALAQPVQVVDDSGAVVRLARPAQRVIALGPHLTEQVFALGAGAQLVGVSRFSNYPEAATRLPVVGDAVSLQIEQIAQLKPDLVLVWRTGFSERSRAPLRALGVPIFESEIRDVPQIGSSLRRLGVLLGQVDAARIAADRIDAEWQALQATYAGRPTVRVFYQLWHQPLMTINRQHLIDQAITACGGRNIFAELPTLTPTVSWEAAVQRNPQVIAMAGGANDYPELGQWPRFAQVDAVRQGRFALLNGDLINRMGPRFLEGVRALCAAIDGAR